MSGILGIWNLDGQGVEKRLITRLSARLAHRGPDGEGVWIRGPIGMACRLLRISPEAEHEVQPLVESSLAVVFDGRLDNREELLHSLSDSVQLAPMSSDPVIILAAYKQFGDRVAERLLGDFALGIFDGQQQQLLLARDAIGIRPLYYSQVADTFLFASEIKSILAHPNVSVRPNDDMLAGYALGGLRDVHDLTCFAGVFSLPPAHVAILSHRGLDVRRYWDFDLTTGIRFESFEEYSGVFRDHLQRAVMRRTRSLAPVVVSVSGGLDSSSILCLAETIRRGSSNRYGPIFGFSATSSDRSPSDETAFLSSIEQHYGLTIERIPMESPGFLRGAKEAVWHSEAPILDTQWNATRRFFETARQHGARVILTGHWADQVLFSQAYLTTLFRRLAWGTIFRHLREYRRWLTDAAPRAFVRRFCLDIMKYHLSDAVVPFLRRMRSQPDGVWYAPSFRRRARRLQGTRTAPGAALSAPHVRSLYEEVRSGYHVACMEWNDKVAAMHGLEMAFPFLDRDLLSFLIRVPGEVQAWKGVPKALLRAGMQGILPDDIIQRTWKADFTHLVNAGVEYEYSTVAQILWPESLAVKLGYLSERVIGEELPRLKSRLCEADAEVARRLCAALGLELWLEAFIGDSDGESELLSASSA
jgi:asparagine synthase (glutamine-hydrolysing)